MIHIETHPHGRIDATVVDYGTPALADRCLESMRGCDLFSSLALVDAKRLGWSYAHSVNTALHGGHGDILLALNADTRMLEEPAAVLDLFDQDPKVAVVGPRQVNSRGMITHGGIFGTNQHPEFRCWQQPLVDHDDATSDTRDAVTVSGAVYFARRTAWEQLGGMLETPHYYEETWLSYLARHRGHRVLYTGATTWLHEWSSSPVTAGWLSETAVKSREMFRAACDREGILC